MEVHVAEDFTYSDGKILQLCIVNFMSWLYWLVRGMGIKLTQRIYMY